MLPVPSYTSFCFDQFLIASPSGVATEGGLGVTTPHLASNDVILITFSDIYFEVLQDKTCAISKC